VKLKFTILLIVFFCELRSQNLREMGFFFGGMNYTGDLSKKLITGNETYPTIGLMYRRTLYKAFDIRYTLLFGNIGGKDANYADVDFDRYVRNLSFKSPLYELSASALYNFPTFRTGNSKDDYSFTPYFGLGLGIFHFDPQAKLNYINYHLRDLPTELNKPSYALTQICIPVNAGVKILFTDKVCVTADLGFRKTFTDYLDDVSGMYSDYKTIEATYGKNIAILTDRSRELGPEYYQQKINDPASKVNRGDSRTKDNYLYLGISLSYYYHATDIRKWKVPGIHLFGKRKARDNDSLFVKTEEEKRAEIIEAERKAEERENSRKEENKRNTDSTTHAKPNTVPDSAVAENANQLKTTKENLEKARKDSLANAKNEADKKTRAESDSAHAAEKEAKEAAELKHKAEKEAEEKAIAERKKYERDSVAVVKAKVRKQAIKEKAKRKSKRPVARLKRKWQRYLDRRRFKKGKF
jgi:hypothetical protein